MHFVNKYIHAMYLYLFTEFMTSESFTFSSKHVQQAYIWQFIGHLAIVTKAFELFFKVALINQTT